MWRRKNFVWFLANFPFIWFDDGFETFRLFFSRESSNRGWKFECTTNLLSATCQQQKLKTLILTKCSKNIRKVSAENKLNKKFPFARVIDFSQLESNYSFIGVKVINGVEFSPSIQVSIYFISMMAKRITGLFINLIIT